jgi:hypothetical protein
MKGNDALQRSYEKQKTAFEISKNKRIKNREIQIEQINLKIQSLEAARAKLVLQNSEEKEFETFDSFRLKAEEQSRLQKR